jgi:ATP-dependent RNA helicase DHR2
MPSSSNSQHPPKRRKTKDAPNTIYVGGKAISLEGYLAPSGPKRTQDASQAAIQEKAGQADGQATAQAESPAVAEKGPSPDHDAKSQHRSRGPPHGSTEDQALLKDRRKLPIWQYQDQIQEALHREDGNVLIIVGETGSGKSTQVPQFLCREPWCRRQTVKLATSLDEVSVGGTIAITQPRRVAATTLAYRVAQEMGTPLGKGRRDGSVGYSVRFDHNVPRGAKIKFLTEGMLLQELLHDPDLRQYSAVVVDEIHERSLDVDLLSGFLKQILDGDNAGRGGIPLKIVIMSATADVDRIRQFFDVKDDKGDKSTKDKDGGAIRDLRIKGRQFPVQIIHEPKPVPDIQASLLQTISRIHTQEQLPGDILAFLTGQEEIKAAQKLIEEFGAALASNVPSIKVIPLYGQLSIEAQREAFLPVKKAFTRKVVLATNIAETSVTVPGVRYVVDCGKAKVKQFRTRLGMESLLAKPISKSSAVQRAGRAGREGPGKCFRLYPEAAFAELRENDIPEMLRTDVLGAILTMKARGIQDVFGFPLMDAPSTEAIEKALIHLHFLGALADDGSLTTAGAQMARFPLPAALGAVLLASTRPEYDCLIEVIDIVSCITSGDDIFLQIQSEEDQEDAAAARAEVQRREGDLLTYLTVIQQYTAENADRPGWCRKKKINIRNMKQALNIRRQLRGMCVKSKLLSDLPPPDPQPFVPLAPERAELVLKCFLRGFALKTAMLAPDASYVTVHGKHVVAIHPSSVLHGRKKEAIMFLEHVFTTKNYAKKVSAIQAAWIVEALENK